MGDYADNMYPKNLTVVARFYFSSTLMQCYFDFCSHAMLESPQALQNRCHLMVDLLLNMALTRDLLP